MSESYRDKKYFEIARRVLQVIHREHFPTQEGVSLLDPRFDHYSQQVTERAGAVMRLLLLTKETDPDKILAEAISARAECEKLKQELDDLKSSPVWNVGKAAMNLVEILKQTKP